MQAMADLSHQFRAVMAGVATPVSVVTTLVDDDPYGTTVSAFASLSMTPPMVLVSLDRGSTLLAAIRRSNRLGLNVLGHHQARLALTFAGKGGPDKFTGVGWHVDHDLPRLPGSPGWLSCTVGDFVDGGDHVIVLGDVVRAETRDVPPLTYHGRAFGTHAALEPA
jgi:flavin reductase (DIM6/NTAB) family NADH-FMN oxidoreductase RutF